MGGQILGGGVIALVVVLLWLIYLLPTWYARVRDNAAERNAVRLNQALRVLAESSEASDDVRIQLSSREVARQQRLVKKLEAEDARLHAEYERAETERRREEHEEKLERTRRDAEAARLTRALEAEERKREIDALKRDPRVRLQAARRRGRLAATATTVAGLVAVGLGTWQTIAVGAWAWLAIGIAVTVIGMLALRRMAAVAGRARRAPQTAPVAVQVARERPEPELLNPADRGWVPRRLPMPLTATAGSRAADEVAAAGAREKLEQAAREEAARRRIAANLPQPISLDEHRDEDAEIERRVREMLARRAAG
jgi:hypothetical protein